MTISHVDPMIDIYAGVDTGVNTTFGSRVGDDNKAIAFHGGIGLNLFDGNLTVLATTHIGPENPNRPAVAAACFCNPNHALRYLNVTVTWKVNDAHAHHRWQLYSRRRLLCEWLWRRAICDLFGQ